MNLISDKNIRFLRYGVYLTALVILTILTFGYAEYFSQSSIWHPDAVGGFFVWRHMWIVFALTGIISLWALIGPERSWKSLALAFLFVFIQQRNFWISDAGDKLFIILLFWHSLILKSKGKSFRILKILFTIQLGLIYFQNGLAKLPHLHESTLSLILSDPGLAYSWVMPLARWPITKIYYVVPFIEILIGFILFTRWRKYAIFFGIFYHVLIGLSLNLGTFSLVMIAWWMILLSLDSVEDTSSEWSIASVAGLIVVIIISVQTITNVMGVKFPAPIEKFLSESYLKQKWSMFGAPWTARANYEFKCYKNEQMAECPEAIKNLSQRSSWSHRELTLLDKMAYRNGTEKLKLGFHSFLCKENRGLSAIEITIKTEIKEEHINARNCPILSE